MSITNDVKGYADAAVETGRSVINDGISQGRGAVNERLTALRTTLDEGIDGAGDRAGKLAETVTGSGSQALDRVRLDAFAAVGAVDAAVTTLVTRLQEFPNDVAGTVAKAQNVAIDAADKVQARVSAVVGKATETVGSAEKTVDDVRSGALLTQARENAEAYRKQVAETVAERRADLAARGEAVVTELRKDPRVVRVAKLVGAAAETVEDAAAKPARSRAAEKAQETRARNERSARAKKAAQTRARKSTGTTATKAAPRKTARTSSPSKATKAAKATS